MFNNPLSLFLGKSLVSSSHVFGQEVDGRLISFFTPPDCRCYEVGPEVIRETRNVSGEIAGNSLFAQGLWP